MSAQAAASETDASMTAEARPALPWYIVRAKYRQETTARSYLTEAGFEVFLAERTVDITDRHNPRKKIPALRPLYPPYVFVAFDRADTPWRMINSIRGVDQILCLDGDTPLRIPTPQIDAVRRWMANYEAERVRKADPKKPAFEIGGQVRAMEGPFTSFNGIVQESDAYVSVIELDIFGRLTKVEFPNEFLEKIE